MTLKNRKKLKNCENERKDKNIDEHFTQNLNTIKTIIIKGVHNYEKNFQCRFNLYW